MRLFTLDSVGNIVPCTMVGEWGAILSDERRFVKQTSINENDVSTIFSGVDYGFNSEGPPKVWETVIFHADGHTEAFRCAGTRADAEAMHEVHVASLRPNRIRANRHLQPVSSEPIIVPDEEEI